MKKVGILTSGGDAPGMNAAIRAATRTLIGHGYSVYGIRNGYRGIIEKDIVPLTRKDVSNLINRGGTFLKSARFPEFISVDVQKKAVEILKELGIDCLIVIGGDGSFKGAKALSDLGINCIALPGTIDNDMSYTDLTIGYLTACQTATESIDKIRDTMSSHSRLCIIEVMGRCCGDLAVRASLASGANYLVTHETGLDIDDLCKAAIKTRESGKEHCVIIITEGITDVNILAKVVEKRTGWSSRGVVLGHIQRGGSPVAEDRVLSTLLGSRAAELIHENKTCRAVGIRNNIFVDFDITEALNVKKQELCEFIDVFNKVV